MSDASQMKPWRFKPGQSGNPKGRPIGSRNKLQEDFFRDLVDVWQTEGVTALRRAAEEEPAQFIKVVASLMPRDLDLAVSHELVVDPVQFASKFRTAMELLGNPVIDKKPLRIIDAKPRNDQLVSAARATDNPK